jgi:hypothetical protein
MLMVLAHRSQFKNLGFRPQNMWIISYQVHSHVWEGVIYRYDFRAYLEKDDIRD